MKSKPNVELPRFSLFSVTAFILGWFLHFAIAISTLLELFSVETALCTFVNSPYLLVIFLIYSLNSFVTSMSSSNISLFSTNLIDVLALTLFEKIVITICQNVLICDIEFTSRFVKNSFFERFKQNYYCFLHSFRGIPVLSLKNLILRLESFIIVLGKSFVINLLEFALRYFCFMRACLFKISMKILRKYWYSILFILCFNILLSSSTLNSSLRSLR